MKMDASDCGFLVYQDFHSNQSDFMDNFFFGKQIPFDNFHPIQFAPK